MAVGSQTITNDPAVDRAVDDPVSGEVDRTTVFPNIAVTSQEVVFLLRLSAADFRALFRDFKYDISETVNRPTHVRVHECVLRGFFPSTRMI